MRSIHGLNHKGGESISIGDHSQPRCIEDCHEIHGPLHSIRPYSSSLNVAQIGQLAVLLPKSLKLPKSGTVFVLRIDDEYYVRKAEPGEMNGCTPD